MTSTDNFYVAPTKQKRDAKGSNNRIRFRRALVGVLKPQNLAWTEGAPYLSTKGKKISWSIAGQKQEVN